MGSGALPPGIDSGGDVVDRRLAVGAGPVLLAFAEEGLVVESLEQRSEHPVQEGACEVHQAQR